MPTFECNGLMDPQNIKPHFKYRYGINTIIDGLMFQKNLSNNINDSEKQLCKSVAWDLKKNFWRFNKERSNEK